MPILESLKITVANPNILSTFEIAPHLTGLELVHREGERGKLGGWAFPWAQLTKLFP